MGFIGYYIKKQNWLSALILAPMIIFLVFLGLGYINRAIESFPHHLLSGIACFTIIVVVVLNIFDNKKHRLVLFGMTLLAIATILILSGGIGDSKFETYHNLDEYNITFVGEIEVLTTSGNKEGSVDIIETENNSHSIKLTGWNSGKYSFTIVDEDNNEYDFEYYFDKNNNNVVLKRINE